MKSLLKLAAVIAFFLAFGSPTIFAEKPPAKETHSPDSKTPQKPAPPFTISKETTYLTEPLRADGYVDYVAALNKICSEGVTPENNAVVLLLQAIGPEIIGSNYRERNYRMLGIEPLPEKGDYLIPYEKFRPNVKTEKDEEEAAPKDPAEQQDLIDQFYKVMAAPWSAEKHPRYAAWLQANQKPLEKIHEAALRPKYYTPMISGDGDYAPMIGVLLWVAQESRACARLLMAHAMYSMGEGKIEDAQHDILACHRLARLEGQGATLVEALVAIAIDGMACSGDVALAQSGKLTPNEAASFQEELRKLPPMPKMSDKINVAERFMFLDSVGMIAKNGLGSLDTIVALTGGGRTDNPLKSAFSSVLTSALDWDTVLRMGHSWYDRMVEAGRKPTYAQRTEAWQKLDGEVRQMSVEVKSLKNVGNSLMAGQSLRTIMGKKMGNILLCLLTPALNAVIKAEERGNVNSDLSQLALALGAYHSDRGDYPARLADLAPKYIAEVPKDRFAAADLIYRLEGKGYILYSVGYNGKDDGGKSNNNDPPDEEGDDIVIRTPK